MCIRDRNRYVDLLAGSLAGLHVEADSLEAGPQYLEDDVAHGLAEAPSDLIFGSLENGDDLTDEGSRLLRLRKENPVGGLGYHHDCRPPFVRAVIWMRLPALYRNSRP